MNIILYLIVSFAYLLLVAEQLLMFVRAIVSWFTQDDESPLATFLYYATEPVIMPVRWVLSRFDAVNDLPIDISFTVSLVLLMLLTSILPTVAL